MQASQVLPHQNCSSMSLWTCILHWCAVILEQDTFGNAVHLQRRRSSRRKTVASGATWNIKLICCIHTPKLYACWDHSAVYKYMINAVSLCVVTFSYIFFKYFTKIYIFLINVIAEHCLHCNSTVLDIFKLRWLAEFHTVLTLLSNSGLLRLWAGGQSAPSVALCTVSENN